jgi:cyclase
MDADHADAVAAIFADSDAGNLPHVLGVRRRSLFTFHDLYLHVTEAEDDLRERIASVRKDPAFTDVSRRLARYISAYDPLTWRGPDDAMARLFYTWQVRSS